MTDRHHSDRGEVDRYSALRGIQTDESHRGPRSNSQYNDSVDRKTAFGGNEIHSNQGDEVEDIELEEEIAQLQRLLRLKAAKRASQKIPASGVHSKRQTETQSERNSHHGSLQNSPPSIERPRKNVPEQDYYVPPAARPSQEDDLESVEYNKVSRNIGNGLPPRENNNQFNPANTREFVPARQQAQGRDDEYKYYQGQRLSSNVFSPGYGFRAPVPGNDTLPPPEELVGPHGTVHRIYPAPGPVCPPINANDGWIDLEPPAATFQSKSSPVPAAISAGYQQQQARPISPPRSDRDSTPSAKIDEHELSFPSSERVQPTHLTSPPPKQGAMVDWETVVYSQDKSNNLFDKSIPSSPAVSDTRGPAVPWTGGVIYNQKNLNEEGDAMTRDELLACFKDRRQGGYGDEGGRGRFQPLPRQDSGYNRPSQGTRQGWTERGGRQQEDEGFDTLGQADGDQWGEPSGKLAKSNDNDGNWGNSEGEKKNSWEGSGASNGYGGGGGGDGCRNCGKNGHYARECPNSAPDKCYNCGENGHMSRDCPQERRGGGGAPGACYNCGQEGHMSRECPEPRGSGGGGGNCFNCEQPGHQARDCPEPRRPGTFRGTCNTCGETGHRSSECQASRSQSGYNVNRGEGDDRAHKDRHNGGDSSWNNQTNESNGDAWKTPVPPSQLAVHPDRAAQVNARPYDNYQRPPHQDPIRPPSDGKARDNGWGGMRRQEDVAPPSSNGRNPTPVTEDDDGGW